MDSFSPRVCRTDSRRSSVSSCGRTFVETRDKRSKTSAVEELFAELVRRSFAGNPADAQAIKHAVRRIIFLNKDGRIGSAEAVAETFGVAAVTERTYLHGEKTGGGIDAAENFHAHRHDTGGHRIHFPRGGKRQIDDAVVHKRAAVVASHHRGLAVVQTGEAYRRFGGQPAVRGGDSI